jgi:hypothetical protein
VEPGKALVSFAYDMNRIRRIALIERQCLMKSTTHNLLIAAVVLQGALIAGQWLGSSPAMARNDLNLPDPGARQLQIVDELKLLNSKVESINATLTSGQMRVRVEKEEK